MADLRPKVSGKTRAQRIPALPGAHAQPTTYGAAFSRDEFPPAGSSCTPPAPGCSLSLSLLTLSLSLCATLSYHTPLSLQPIMMRSTSALRALPRTAQLVNTARAFSASASPSFASPSDAPTPAAGSKPPAVKEFKIYRWVCILVRALARARKPSSCDDASISAAVTTCPPQRSIVVADELLSPAHTQLPAAPSGANAAFRFSVSRLTCSTEPRHPH